MTMLRLFISLNGEKKIWEIPFHEARCVNRTVFAQGGVVYWTERC